VDRAGQGAPAPTLVYLHLLTFLVERPLYFNLRNVKFELRDSHVHGALVAVGSGLESKRRPL
jgi:hypothetical protein